MRREQAEQLVAKLEAAHDRDLRPDTRQLYIDRIMTLPFATGLKRIELLIDTTKFMPKVSEIMRPVEGEIEQQNLHVEDKWLDTDEGKYAAYRSERLVELDENTYWKYLHDPATRARLENEWKHSWSQGERRAG